MNPDTTPLHDAGSASSAADHGSDAWPADFSAAVESMHAASLRPEITLGTIRPPQRPAPFSHAIGLEVAHPDEEHVPVDSEGDAFGRLILLHSPAAQEAWEGSMRLVAYIQADMDDAVASDPLLPDVAWQWLNESFAEKDARYTNLGGTVTSTASVRFGEIGGPQEAEASAWIGDNFSKPVIGFVAGLTAPKGRRMGHAGAIISAAGDSAAEKAEIMKSYGLTVAPDPGSFGSTVAEVLNKRRKAA